MSSDLLSSSKCTKAFFSRGCTTGPAGELTILFRPVRQLGGDPIPLSLPVCALEVNFNVMRSMNSRFTYLLTYLLDAVGSSSLRPQYKFLATPMNLLVQGPGFCWTFPDALPVIINSLPTFPRAGTSSWRRH